MPIPAEPLSCPFRHLLGCPVLPIVADPDMPLGYFYGKGRARNDALFCPVGWGRIAVNRAPWRLIGLRTNARK
ncbi:hypothetical protein Bind_2960 [Beijerinckia indica subsp. indica ATCC 9039]|uniref:Uncharacterized protein n=1 Tax=Beijerinckia indica subsp. indica (strain ATCC 9039 / DSM 1715 / NCIMB 8712) TaxID=395963 RepID=B2IKY7_BEII9|nr:hypothetical protein Bind_2960 [Beijerinckia indica subsp. indica ATCC 9039]